MATERYDLGRWGRSAKGNMTRRVSCIQLTVFWSDRDAGYIYSIIRRADICGRTKTGYSKFAYKTEAAAMEAVMKELPQWAN